MFSLLDGLNPALGSDPRQISLIVSLRDRYRLAEQRQDVKAKQELFREAIYLGIQLKLFIDDR